MAAPSTPTRRPTGTLEAPTPPCMSPIKTDESAKPARVLEFPELPIGTQNPASYEEFIIYQATQHAREEARADAEEERKKLQSLVTQVVFNPTRDSWLHLLAAVGHPEPYKHACIAVKEVGK